MWYRRFVKWKDEVYDTCFLMIRMVCNPLMMMLQCLWIVITCQEEKWIEKNRMLAEQDRKDKKNVKPNEFIQGVAVTVSLSKKRSKEMRSFVFHFQAEQCPPSLAVRSALRWQFWSFYWDLERERLRLSRTLPATITSPGQPVPEAAKLIPVFTDKLDLLESSDKTTLPIVSLRSLMKKGRYLVINFGSCT